MDLSTAVAAAREVARTVTEDDASRVDREGTWPRRSLRALQDAGLGGLVVPADAGGLGLGLEGLARVGMELGHACASTGLCFGMHNVGAAVIAAKATPAQKQAFLEPICAGEHLTTLALSEPGTGAHFYLPETRLVPNGEGYRLHGTKCFATNGGHADSYVVSTQTPSDDGSPGVFSCVVAPGEADGMDWMGDWNGLGMRGNSSRTVMLDDVGIPADRVLGEPGDHGYFIFDVVAPYFLMAMAGTYYGVARRAMDEALAHVKSRSYEHNGATLARVDVLQRRIGELWSRLRSAQQYVIWAAQQGDQGDEDALPALLASKALMGDVAVETVNECMTLMGGIGYRKGTIMERLLRDVRAVHVMSPTTDLLYTWTGRALLDEPLLAD